MIHLFIVSPKNVYWLRKTNATSSSHYCAPYCMILSSLPTSRLALGYMYDQAGTEGQSEDNWLLKVWEPHWE